jgi:hypothetical protein
MIAMCGTKVYSAMKCFPPFFTNSLIALQLQEMFTKIGIRKLIRLVREKIIKVRRATEIIMG